MSDCDSQTTSDDEDSTSSSSSAEEVTEWGQTPLVPQLSADGIYRIDSSDFLGVRGPSPTTSLLSWPDSQDKPPYVEIADLRLHRGTITVSSGQTLTLNHCEIEECRISAGSGATLHVRSCKWKGGLRPAIHVCLNSMVEGVEAAPHIVVQDCTFSDMQVALSLEMERYPSEDDITDGTTPAVSLKGCHFTHIRGAAVVMAIHLRSPIVTEQLPSHSIDETLLYHIKLNSLLAIENSSLNTCAAEFEISIAGSKLLRPFSFSSWPLVSGEYLTPRRGSAGRGAPQVKATVSEDSACLKVSCPPASGHRKRSIKNRSSSSLTQVGLWMETLGCSEDVSSLSREMVMSSYRRRSLAVHPDKRGSGSSEEEESSSPEDFLNLVQARDELLQWLEGCQDKRGRRRR
ncbi:hypothetical protein FOL47_005134 [Perkinsus chesapeaki]|uniref:J domain-containing protein n=1 Tax=Perkinsus chesapeaki TaxID=330153 RepID=A0A7J6LYP8_PERCH|nr:hypothetical protein FOL47_005134 [Perkinsus chesapeaki]